MEIAVDIQKKLELNFGRELAFAKDEIEALYAATNWSITNRMVRAIIFLSGDDLDLLKTNIDRATTDFKDLLWQAEYNRGDDQLRDFNKTFEELDLL